MWLRLFLWRTLFRSTEIELTEVVVLIPEFGSKPRPQLPNRHRLAVDADPKPGIRSGASSYLAHQNDMTGMPQFINPYRDTWAGGPQRIVVCVHHRQARVLSANSWDAQCGRSTLTCAAFNFCERFSIGAFVIDLVPSGHSSVPDLASLIIFKMRSMAPIAMLTSAIIMPCSIAI